MTPPFLLPVIATDADLRAVHRRIELLWGAPRGSREGRELDLLIDLADTYTRRRRAETQVAGTKADLPEPDPGARGGAGTLPKD